LLKTKSFLIFGPFFTTHDGCRGMNRIYPANSRIQESAGKQGYPLLRAGRIRLRKYSKSRQDIFAHAHGQGRLGNGESLVTVWAGDENLRTASASFPAGAAGDAAPDGARRAAYGASQNPNCQRSK